MWVYRCDRCKTVLEGQPTFYWRIKDFDPGLYPILRFILGTDEIHLCVPCKVQFDEWWQQNHTIIRDGEMLLP